MPGATVRPVIEWSASLSVGIAEIDAQHKHLIHLLNRLNHTLKTGSGFDAASDTLQELAEYALLHFRTEEQYMREAEYPGLAEQLTEHESFSRQVIGFSSELRRRDALVAVKILFFLRDWVFHHITQIDMKMRQYFCPPEEDADPGALVSQMEQGAPGGAAPPVDPATGAPLGNPAD